MITEYHFQCPYCWQEISVLLDLSVQSQEYIEDCEVCCRPIQIRYSAEIEEVISFTASVPG